MSAVISVEKLSKWYGNVLGLSDVTLDIEAGVTGILGPNGAGKSTFLKLITGQIKSNIGSV
ncbi:MAG: ATP-binding cassette domain-containing protein, partial [Candidatus Aminicenantes bacterium]|nr:ATP-binding cassette domain-containing protein [Candidatus Aminicenantes bacterium]